MSMTMCHYYNRATNLVLANELTRPLARMIGSVFTHVDDEALCFNVQETLRVEFWGD